MTIRRQYSLPNCTLILDGLSDNSSNSGILDPRPLMSQLLNAECHFAGYQEPLTGGQDFLNSLVVTVNNYAQEFLSGIAHSRGGSLPENGISLVKGDRDNVHYLQFVSANGQVATPTRLGKRGKDSDKTQIELSTVQLFDLVEAIDQFLADRRTLPDVNPSLKPIPKNLTNPIAKQVAPAGLGLASLATIAVALHIIPAPKVEQPKVINVTPPTTQPAPLKPGATTQPSPSTKPPSP
jgi:Domain of unknown function (DUF4335)